MIIYYGAMTICVKGGVSGRKHGTTLIYSNFHMATGVLHSRRLCVTALALTEMERKWISSKRQTPTPYLQCGKRERASHKSTATDDANQHNQQWPQVCTKSFKNLVDDLQTVGCPETKTPQQLLQTVPFNLVFRDEDGTDVKTDTVLSKT